MTSSDSKSLYMREIYVQGVAGVVPSTPTSYKALEDAARRKLHPQAYWYVAGGASTGSTMDANRRALDRFRIVPRMLTGVKLEDFDMETSLFGQQVAAPVVIAPIGVQAQLNKEDADCATAAGAEEAGVPYTHSTAASRSIEEVAEKVPDGVKWYQLYWPDDDEITSSLLQRAKKAGYKVLVVTLDTWSLGWRPNDLDTAYNPFLHGQGVANLFSDPVFVNKYLSGQSPLRKDISLEDLLEASALAVGQLSPNNSRSWEELQKLRMDWDGPIVLKGVQDLEDAKRAHEAGVQGVVVSNHGGRQVDGAVASIDCLPSIAAYLRPRGMTVLFDSGVRCGADIMKALCLGAHAVMIGRPWAWGLAVNGQDGVRDVVRGLLADLELNAGLAGCKSIKEFGPHLLRRESERGTSHL